MVVTQDWWGWSGAHRVCCEISDFLPFPFYNFILEILALRVRFSLLFVLDFEFVVGGCVGGCELGGGVGYCVMQDQILVRT